jgi:hypothetical protein
MKVSLRVLVLFCLLAFVLGIGGGYVVFTVTGGDSAAPSANPALAHDDRRAPDNEEETGKRNGRDAQQPGGNPSGNEVSDHTPAGDNLTKPAPAPTDTPGTEPGNAASNPATPKDSEPADAEREEPETPFGRTVDFEVTISGTVVDAHGRPVANAAIDSSITERAERSVRIKSGPVFARTDSDGTFTGTLKSKAGDKGTTSVILVASATGHADSNPLTLEIANGTAKTGVRIALRAAGSVMGRAVDRNGIGVPGVTVTLAPRAGDSGIQVGGPGTVSSGSSAPKGVSDANGDFVVQDLPAGSFNITVSARGYKEFSGPRTVDVKVDTVNRLTAEIVVTPTTCLRARLTGEDGAPLRGYVQVKLTDAEGAKAGEFHAFTDHEGRIAVNDPPLGGYYVVIIRAEYADTEKTWVTFVQDQTTDLGTLAMKPEQESETNKLVTVEN